jgi:hypothetical protein
VPRNRRSACFISLLPAFRKLVYRSAWRTDNHRIKRAVAPAESERSVSGPRGRPGRDDRARTIQASCDPSDCDKATTARCADDGPRRGHPKARTPKGGPPRSRRRPNRLFLEKRPGTIRPEGEGVGEHVRTRFHRKQTAAGETADLREGSAPNEESLFLLPDRLRRRERLPK